MVLRIVCPLARQFLDRRSRAPSDISKARAEQNGARGQRRRCSVCVEVLNLSLHSGSSIYKDSSMNSGFEPHPRGIRTVEGRVPVTRRVGRSDTGKVVLLRLDQVVEAKKSRLVDRLRQSDVRADVVLGPDLIIQVYELEPVGGTAAFRQFRA